MKGTPIVSGSERLRVFLSNYLEGFGYKQSQQA